MDCNLKLLVQKNAGNIFSSHRRIVCTLQTLSYYLHLYHESFLHINRLKAAAVGFRILFHPLLTYLHLFTLIALFKVVRVYTAKGARFQKQIKEIILWLAKHAFVNCSGGFWGTAVCTFSLATIEYVFSQSPFKTQRTFESNWGPVPDSQVPRPRPGQVSHRVGQFKSYLF